MRVPHAWQPRPLGAAPSDRAPAQAPQAGGDGYDELLDGNSYGRAAPNPQAGGCTLYQR